MYTFITFKETNAFPIQFLDNIIIIMKQHKYFTKMHWVQNHIS